MKQNKKTLAQKLFAVLTTALLLATNLAILPTPADAALSAVGPIQDPINNGYPQWFADENGLALQLCLDQGPTGLCVLTPGFDPLTPPVTPIGTVASGNFPDESFYFIADALIDPGVRLLGANTDIKITYRAALEQAFLAGIAPGAQNIFLRVQADINGLVPNSTYSVAGPYGTFDVTTDATGGGRTRFEDLGSCVTLPTGPFCTFADPSPITNPVLAAATTNVGSFLQWDNTLPAPPAGFIGDPNVLHTVSGGRGGINSVTVTGTDVGGPGVGSISTNLFAVAGQLADTIPPTIGATNPASATLGDTNVVFSANVTDNMGIAANGATVDLGALGNNLTANLTGAQEVPTTAATYTGNGTFTIDTAANLLTGIITWSGSQAPDGVETAAHIHGPAAAGANALPLFDLPLGLTKNVNWNYPEASEADILAGRTYVNIHTTLFPNGAIRGQILPAPNVQNMALTAGTTLNGTWSFVIPNFNKAGTFILPVKATDGSGNSVTANHTLSIVALTSISVAPATATIIGAGTQQLTASSLDNNGAPFVGATVTWSSSNPAVATVDANGLVTGVLSQTPGTATITATATSGATAVTGSSVISVSPGLPVLTAVNVTPNPASIIVNPLTPAGSTLQLNAAALDQFSAPFVGATVTWTSSDNLIATVDAAGLVTTVAPGQVTITATASDGALPAPTTASGTAIVTVTTEPQVATSVSVTPATAALTTGTQQLTATQLDQFGGPMAPQPTFIWSSSNPLVATVDATGLVTPVGAGTVAITASDGILNSASAITVSATLTSINVTPATASVVIASTQQLTAATLDQFGAAISPAPAVTWTSSNPAVATVDATGLVTGVTAGTATITAASGLISGTAAIAVVTAPPVLTTINVTPATATITGVTQQLTASTLDQFGSLFTPAPAVTWTSSNPAVATVDASGLVTAVSAGSATITAASGAISGTAAITVSAVATSLTVTPTAAATNIAATQQLAAAVLDQFNNPISPAPAVTWTSSNPAVATVDATGLVTGVTAGTATITAASGAISGTAAITVPVVLTAADLSTTIGDGGGGVFTIPALTPATSTPSVTIALPLSIDVPLAAGGGANNISMPAGTIISKVDGTNLDATALSASETAASALSNLGDVVINGAVQWGISNIGLQFSQPITIKIFVGTGLNGQTINIVRSVTGNSDWTSDGIVAPATGVVADGFVTFQATKASFFAATTPAPAPAPAPAPTPAPAPVSGGGGGAPINIRVVPAATRPSAPSTPATPTTPGEVLGEVIFKREEGDLLRAQGDFRVFRITKSGAKRHITSPEEFKSLGLRWEDIVEVSPQEIAFFPQFRLLRAAGDPKVFRVENNQKIWIRSAAIFNDSGYDWREVEVIEPQELTNLTEVRLVRAKGDFKVFRATATSKAWIRTQADFERQGFSWDQVEVVEPQEVATLAEVTSETELA